MLRIGLFVEDYGHEAFITALIERYAKEYKLPVEVIARSVRGGFAKVVGELKDYIRDLKRQREDLLDLLVVATDSNCHGYAGRKHQIDEVLQEFNWQAVCAIPDPHIERWMLLDSVAFKEVLGKGCAAPDQKCDKDRYKDQLLQAMRAVGISPPLGGMEYAADIVDAMDLKRMEQVDTSLGRLLGELRHKFKEWKRK